DIGKALCSNRLSDDIPKWLAMIHWCEGIGRFLAEGLLESGTERPTSQTVYGAIANHDPSAEKISPHVGVIPAPGHVVEKIVVHIDEDPEDEEKQRRTEYLCIVRHQVLQADRSTPETHKTDYEPDQDESQQPQAMLLAQPSLENGQGRLIHS